MGIWGVIGSTTEAVKRNVADLTPLKNASRASYDYGSAACTRIDQAVRTNGFHALTQRMPENKTIGLYASIIAKHTADYVLQEGYKLIPGGVVASKIIANTLNDVRKESLKAEKLQASSQEKVVTPSIKETVSNEGHHLDLATKETQEDMIRGFIKAKLCGTRFLDDLMVPKVTKGEKTG